MKVYVQFYNIKGSLDSEMSKERVYIHGVYAIDKRSLHNYIS